MAAGGPRPSRKVGMFRGIVNATKSSVGVGVYTIPFMFMCTGPTFGLALLVFIVCISSFCVEQLVATRHALEVDQYMKAACDPDAAAGLAEDPPVATQQQVDLDNVEDSVAPLQSVRQTVDTSTTVNSGEEDSGDEDNDSADETSHLHGGGVSSHHRHHRAPPTKARTLGTVVQRRRNRHHHHRRIREDAGDDEGSDVRLVEPGTNHSEIEVEEVIPGALTLNTDQGQRNSYPNLAYRSLGMCGRIFALVTIWLAMYGSLISYLIFFKQNLPALVPATAVVEYWIPLLSWPVLVAFLLFRDMSLLFYVNATAMMFLVVAAVLIGTAAWPHLDLKTTQILLDWPDATSADNLGREPKVTPETIAVAFGICAFAMEGLIALAMENYDSIKSPKKNYGPLLWISMFVFTFLYAVFSILSCYAFLDQPGGIQESVLENFPTGDGEVFWQVVGLLCVGQVFLTYPLVFVVPRQLIEEEFSAFFGVNDDPTWKFALRRFILRVGLIGVSCIIATVVTDFTSFLGLLGCVVNTASIFVLPNLMYLKTVSGWNCKSCRAVAAFTVMIGGVILAAISAYSIIAS